MIKLEINKESHSLKHDIEIELHTCRNCGKEVEVNIPVISKDFVGFESTPHEPCGLGFRISILKPREL